MRLGWRQPVLAGDGMFSSAVKVNDVGQVVGISQMRNGDDHAFLWESGVIKAQPPSMSRSPHGGDKLFVDYSGNKPHIVDPQTGAVRVVEPSGIDRGRRVLISLVRRASPRSFR